MKNFLIFLKKTLLNKKVFKVSMHNVSLAFKKAYSISLLPARVEVFYSSLVLRIFRVIGGSCLVLVLTGKYTVFYKEIQIIILFFSLLHSILLTFIVIIRFFYGLYVIIKKPEVFEVRNSPLNPLSTQLARLLTCAKWGCGAAAGTTGILAGAVTYDTIIEATGREKVFVPMIAKAFNEVFGEPMKPEHYTNLKTTLSNTTPPKDFDLLTFQKGYEQMSQAEKEALYKYVAEERRKSNS